MTITRDIWMDDDYGLDREQVKTVIEFGVRGWPVMLVLFDQGTQFYGSHHSGEGRSQ